VLLHSIAALVVTINAVFPVFRQYPYLLVKPQGKTGREQV
jgi:hypothetical protein